MSKIPPVFISYARDGASGQALARELYQRLKDENISAFLDEHGIRLGRRWIRKLSDGVEHCKVMISVVSPASHNRSWVEKEYIMASRVGALIIPVLANKGDLPFQICDLQGIELFGDQKESNWQSLLDEIKSSLPGISPEKQRQTETDYLNKLLQDNDDRALAFASKVYAPLAGEYRKERKRIAVAAMSPRLRHRKQTRYDEPQDPQGECTEHDDIIAAFRQHKRLVILGEPGAGKTFSLWRIAAEQAQLALDDEGQPIPVVIPLNRWDDPALSLHDFVLLQMDQLAESFDSLYQAKRILPLFDALNEIPFDQREVKLPQVREWLKNYPCDEVLLTCRKRDYRGPLEQDLDRLTIEPLDPPRIYDFLHNYFSGDDAEREMADNLFWQLAGGDRIRNIWKVWESEGYRNSWARFWMPIQISREWLGTVCIYEGERKICLLDPRSMLKLASNPYFLNLLVSIYDDDLQLPESRVGLFTMFVDDLIFRETEARPINHYPKAHQLVLYNELKQLAWNLQSRTGSMEEMRTVLPRSEAELLMPVSRLEFSAAASLVELDRKRVRFSHQLLQEFFTSQSFEEQITSGLKVSDLWPLSSWWEASGWDEVAKFAVELQTDPIKFLQWLAEGNPILAVEIARDQNLIDHRVGLFSGFVDKWVAAITDIDQFPDIRERHAISTALAWLDRDKRAGVGLNEENQPDIAWVDVPKGDFIYGDIDSLTQEYLETFQMSKFPVTNAQFKAFIDDGGYEEGSWWQGIPVPDNKPHHQSSEGNRPVEGIAYYDAIAFCNWLSAQTGDDIRLPTEKQWEKAARGIDGRYYTWGNEYTSTYANVNEVLYKVEGDLLGGTSAVGIFPQAESPFHVLDMNGNVGEWCIRDNNNEKASIFSSDPSMDIGVTRGGSWLDDPESCRSTFRSILPTEFRHINQGIRLVKLIDK